jgi:hypothetical protein
MSKMEKLVRFLPLLISTHAMAATPCDFKGVSVGDKVTPAALMAAFGVKDYRMNPESAPLEKTLKLAEKYSLVAAGEIENWNVGPACYDSYCRIPFGVGVGNDNLPVSLFISFSGGRVTEIDVTFNQMFWDDITPTLDKKYGAAWRVDRDPYFLIINKENSQRLTVERITLNHRTNGTNPKTGDTCMIWAVNYDIVYMHHDPLGAFHSVFVIKLISKNF